jgi:hypothetical protein
VSLYLVTEDCRPPQGSRPPRLDNARAGASVTYPAFEHFPFLLLGFAKRLAATPFAPATAR